MKQEPPPERAHPLQLPPPAAGVGGATLPDVTTEPPLISCLMVTGSRPALAGRAIACYLAQTYPRKELIIVDDGDDTLHQITARLARPDIVHVRLQREAERTLGDLRNLSLAAATGQFVAQWDDDDWYAAHRLQVQFDAIRLRGADACFLHRWIVAWPERGLYGVSHGRKWEGSMLARNAGLPRYPSMRRGEDLVFVEALAATQAKIIQINRPRLYVYVYHGHNTYQQSHFEPMFNHPRFRPLPADEARRIAECLGQNI